MTTNYIDHGEYIELDGACIPRDAQNADYRRFQEWVSAGNQPTAAQAPVQARILAMQGVIQAHLDAAARAKGYDDIRSAALRAGYQGPYHAEGLAFATWMDATWQRGYELLAQWQGGQLAEPTPQELLALMPTLELPT